MSKNIQIKSYYNNNIRTTNLVSSKLLDSSHNIIENFRNRICFSDITYHRINKQTKFIVVYHSLKQIPYSKTIIKQWIKELNILGFPCSVEFNKKEPLAEFTIRLSDYQKKIHVSITLQLIRYLTETYICRLPELYFQELDKLKVNNIVPSIDKKYEILQNIHVLADKNRKCYGLNTNHTITETGNFDHQNPLTQKEIMNRICAEKAGVYDKWDYHSINDIWKS